MNRTSKFLSLLVLITILFLACEDSQSRKKEKVELTSIENVQTKTEARQKNTSKKKEKKYPVFDDQSAMEFFLEYDKHNKENKVRIHTDFGTIDILLYKETKFHRSNFIYLTKRQYFDRTQFYRVVPNFVIQGGSSDDYMIAKRRQRIGKYLLPPDTKRGFTHKRGAVSMPSSEIENAYKLASPYQFFIVQQQGGAHHLDGDYTVFGEVISGMDVVDKIAQVETDEGDWPIKNVYIDKVRIID
jgi:peptidyl-prolyl cis-trans isomerase A (cyclophilin A)